MNNDLVGKVLTNPRSASLTLRLLVASADYMYLWKKRGPTQIRPDTKSSLIRIQMFETLNMLIMK